TGGIVTTSLLGGDEGHDVAVYPNAGTPNDSKIVVVGLSGAGGFHREVARYNTDGSLDTTFGTGGEIISAPGRAFAAAVAADGKVVVAGDNVADGTSSGSFTVARYNVDGTPDSTFGNGGQVTTTIGTSSSGRNVALQPNGDLVVAGYASNGTKNNFAVAR